jgi:DNA-binding NarL/FixJ family response regulator
MRARAPSSRQSVVRATDREVGVVAAVLAAGSEKAAAHRLGLSHSTVKHHLANARLKAGVATTAQLVWILATRLPEPEATGRDRSTTWEGGPEPMGARGLQP